MFYDVFFSGVTSLILFLQHWSRSSSNLWGRMEEENFSLPLSQDTFKDLWDNV